MRKVTRVKTALAVFLYALTIGSAIVLGQQGSQGTITGTVKDQDGASISGASVSLRHSQQAMLRTTITDGSGRFSFDNVTVGSYQLVITQSGFDQQTTSAHVAAGKTTELEIVLQVAPVSSQVTVTAETGQAEDKDRFPQAVNIISERGIQERTTGVLAQVADEEVGLALQGTSPTIAMPYQQAFRSKNKDRKSAITSTQGFAFTTAASTPTLPDSSSMLTTRLSNKRRFCHLALRASFSAISRSSARMRMALSSLRFQRRQC